MIDDVLIGRIKYEEVIIDNMYFISTKYHLLILDISDVFELLETFIMNKKEEIFDLVKVLNPEQYVIVGVMEISKSKKMVWVEDYDVAGRDVSLDDLFDYIYDSINYYSEDSIQVELITNRVLNLWSVACILHLMTFFIPVNRPIATTDVIPTSATLSNIIRFSCCLGVRLLLDSISANSSALTPDFLNPNVGIHHLAVYVCCFFQAIAPGITLFK